MPPVFREIVRKIWLVAILLIRSHQAIAQPAPTFPPDQTVARRLGDGPRRDMLLINQGAKLPPVEVWLDRPVSEAFFVNEVFKLSLKLRNPTSEPLEIADPEVGSAGTFDLFMVAPTRESTDFQPDILDNSPSVILAPGAEINIERWSDGHFHNNAQEPTWFFGGTVFRPGTYVLRSAHTADALRLTFVTPRLITVTVVNLPQTKRNPRNGDPNAPTFCRLYTLTNPAKPNEYFLYANSSPQLFTNLGKLITGGLLDTRYSGPIVRVAKSNLPITSVTGTVTSTGLLVDYTTSDGSHFSVALNADFKPQRSTVPPTP